MTACPACTSTNPSLCSTRNIPFSTTVNSSKLGVWPGSTHPPGLRMWATLAEDVFEFTRPMYSSMSFGLFPAAWMRVGWAMSVGMKSLVLSEELRIQGYINTDQSSDRRERAELGPASEVDSNSELRIYGQG